MRRGEGGDLFEPIEQQLGADGADGVTEVGVAEIERDFQMQHAHAVLQLARQRVRLIRRAEILRDVGVGVVRAGKRHLVVAAVAQLGVAVAGWSASARSTAAQEQRRRRNAHDPLMRRAPLRFAKLAKEKDETRRGGIRGSRSRNSWQEILLLRVFRVSAFCPLLHGTGGQRGLIDGHHRQRGDAEVRVRKSNMS